MPDPIPFPRAKPRIVRPAPPELHRQVERDDWLANRPKRKPEPSRGERITGAIAIALVGLVSGYFAGHFFGGPF